MGANIEVEVKLDLNNSGGFATDITSYVLHAEITRGRKKALEPISPSTLTLTLNNADGRFGPDRGTYAGLDHYIGVRFRAKRTGQAYVSLFTGWITKILPTLAPSNSTAVLESVDYLGIGQEKAIDLAHMGSTACLLPNVAHRILDKLEPSEICKNPIHADGTTGYSALNGGVLTAIDRDTSPPLEGDYLLNVDVDGESENQGWEYDLTDLIAAGESCYACRYAFTGGVDLSGFIQLRLYDDVTGEHDDYGADTTDAFWQRYYAYGTFDAASTTRSVRMRTIGSPNGNFRDDCLHVFRGGLAAAISRSFGAPIVAAIAASFAQIPASQAMQDLMDSCCAIGYFDGSDTFQLDRRSTLRPANKAIDATFSDAGVNLAPAKLVVNWDSYDRISKAQVSGRGKTKDITEDQAISIWECGDVPFTVKGYGPPGIVTRIRARYSLENIENPTLNVTPAAGGFQTARLSNYGSFGDILLQNETFVDWDITKLTITATKRTAYTDTASFVERYPVVNYLLDPSFERGDNDADDISDGWEEHDKDAGVNTTWSLDAGVKQFGAQSQKLVLTADADGAARQVKLQVVDAEVVPVREGEPYAVSSYINVTALSGVYVTLYIEWLDSDKANVSDTAVSTQTATTAGFVRGSDTGMVPAGVAYARPYWRVHLIGEGDSLTAYFDGVQYEKADAVSTYCDGDQPDSLWEEGDHSSRSCRVPDLLVHRTLKWRMPLIDSDSDEAVEEAVRLANRYSQRIVTAEMLLTPKNDDLIDEMLGREINDLVAIISDNTDANLNWASPGKKFWVEGVRHSYRPGPYFETVFSLEEF